MQKYILPIEVQTFLHSNIDDFNFFLSFGYRYRRNTLHANGGILQSGYLLPVQAMRPDIETQGIKEGEGLLHHRRQIRRYRKKVRHVEQRIVFSFVQRIEKFLFLRQK